MRTLVLCLAALLSVTIVAAMFVSSRKAPYEAAAPQVDVEIDDVEQRVESELGTAAEVVSTSERSKRIEVLAPIDDEVAAEQALPRLRFSVVDALTLRPVERFGLRLSAPQHERASDTESFVGALTAAIEVVAHRSGSCELVEQIGERGYQVEAPGFASQEGWIESEARTGAQTIRLAPAGSISARVLLDGKPVRVVSARVRRAEVDQPRASAERYDLNEFVGRTRSIGKVKNGELHFSDLAAGTYELDIHAPRRVSLAVDRVTVTQGRDTALGNLFLTPNPIVSFTVLFPGQRIPAQFKVTAKCGIHGSAGRIDAAGKFTIEDLPPGRWKLSPPVIEGVVASGPPLEFDIAPGDRREFALDLRDRPGFWLAVDVRANGRAASDVVATVKSAAGETTSLAPTDADGKARGWLNANQPWTVLVASQSNLPLTARPIEIVPSAYAEFRAQFDIEAGRLELHWTDLDGYLDARDVSLALESTQVPEHRSSFSVRSGRFKKSETRNEGRRKLGLIAAGEYKATLGFRHGPASQPIDSKYSKIVVIRAAEVCDLRFTNEDLVQ